MKSMLEIIQPIKLLKGSHPNTGETGQGCAMNVIAYLNGEAVITDNSSCVCVTARKPLIWLNDFLLDDERQELVPYLLRAMGSATDDEAVINTRLGHVVLFAAKMAVIAKRAADVSDPSASTLHAAFAAAAFAAADAETTAANAIKATKAACTTAAAIVASYAADAAASYTTYATCAVAAASYAADAATAATRTFSATATLRKEIKAAGFAFLDAVLPKPPVHVPEVFERAKLLAALAF